MSDRIYTHDELCHTNEAREAIIEELTSLRRSLAEANKKLEQYEGDVTSSGVCATCVRNSVKLADDALEVLRGIAKTDDGEARCHCVAAARGFLATLPPSGAMGKREVPGRRRTCMGCAYNEQAFEPPCNECFRTSHDGSGPDRWTELIVQPAKEEREAGRPDDGAEAACDAYHGIGMWVSLSEDRRNVWRKVALALDEMQGIMRKGG